MIFILTLLMLLACAIALWVRSLRTRNVAIVDIFWGLGFALVAALNFGANYWSLYRESAPIQVETFILCCMVVVWGCRLASYLAIRNWGKPEDYRYAAMREHWGERFAWRSLFTVFVLQSVLIWVISMPVQLGLAGSFDSKLRTILGFIVWAVGLFFETVGDWQMYRFKKNLDNRGKVMDQGLWRYTRHPNYFGDFLVWWGIFLFAAQPSSWWWSILGPLLMSFLLLRVSGVTLLESSLKNRLSGYERYVNSTSSFFPRPPKL